MSIYANVFKNGYFLECDKCMNEAEVDDFKFWSDAAEYVLIEENGWQTKYEGGGRIHICPACQDKNP